MELLYLFAAFDRRLYEFIYLDERSNKKMTSWCKKNILMEYIFNIYAGN
jgi:hypothetical protein